MFGCDWSFDERRHFPGYRQLFVERQFEPVIMRDDARKCGRLDCAIRQLSKAFSPDILADQGKKLRQALLEMIQTDVKLKEHEKLPHPNSLARCSTRGYTKTCVFGLDRESIGK